MRGRTAVIVGLIALSFWAARAAINLGVEAYPGEVEHPESVLPPDGDVKAEWAFAKLRYDNFTGGFGGYGGFRGYRGRRRSWGTDSPKAERFLAQGVRRLTRVDARSVEEVINLGTDQVYNWPWLYAVEVGHWQLSDAEAKQLREYLLRGGFFMTDDFHGTREWDVFTQSMQKVFPDRPIVEIEDSDQIFHTVFDLPSDKRFQVPGAQYLRSGQTYEYDGYIPHWRAIYDDKGRIMVAICFNQDHGDAWEWADEPEYAEKYTSQAYRIGVNYLIYAMTH
jgi:hypothetical protein